MAKKTVFLVEDSALVVLSLEGLFEDMEWAVDGPATRLDEALRLAETTQADVALIDVNLDGERSWPVAQRLRERGIPVVFATGYDSASVVPDEFGEMPVVAKPFVVAELENLLRSLASESQPRS